MQTMMDCGQVDGTRSGGRGADLHVEVDVQLALRPHDHRRLQPCLGTGDAVAPRIEPHRLVLHQGSGDLSERTGHGRDGRGTPGDD